MSNSRWLWLSCDTEHLPSTPVTRFQPTTADILQQAVVCAGATSCPAVSSHRRWQLQYPCQWNYCCRHATTAIPTDNMPTVQLALDLIMTFANDPPDLVSVDPVGLMSVHATVTCYCTISNEMLWRHCLRISAKPKQQVLMDTYVNLCQFLLCCHLYVQIHFLLYFMIFGNKLWIDRSRPAPPNMLCARTTVAYA